MDLREQKRWKVTVKDGEDILQGKYGIVSVMGDGLLDVWATSPIIAGRIERSGWKAKNHYDDGLAFRRPFVDLDRAATWLKCRQKRKVTEAMRERGRELQARLRSSKLRAQQEALSATKPPTDAA